MRFYIQSPDEKGQIDGSVQNNLLKYLPNQMPTVFDADVVIVPVSMLPDYKFNQELHAVSQPVVIIDFLEYEWNWSGTESHLLGKNTRECRWIKENWHPLDDWAKTRNVVLYLKRELLRKDVTDRVKPIEWPCYMEARPLQSEIEFNNRCLEVLHMWGYSHPSRPKLHANIFNGMNTHGLGVISEFDHYGKYFSNGAAPRTWMSVFTPHYVRRHYSELRGFQEQAKLTVSLPGCGVKCFRHGEAPVDSIMALPLDDMAWSHEWVHGENCIRLHKGHEFEDLEVSTRRSDLYQIYLNSQETINKYRGPQMISDYILPLLSKVL